MLTKHSFLGSLEGLGTLQETTNFVFTLTEKDSGKVRYGVCLNFYQSFETHKPTTSKKQKQNENTTKKVRRLCFCSIF